MGAPRRLIAFDLDGTLVDSRRDLADSANALIQELGGTPLAEDAVGRMVGEGAGVLVRRALAAAGVACPPAALDRFLEIYDARLLVHTQPYDGIPSVIAAAREHARVVVLTNKPLAATERILEGLGLRTAFDDVVGGDGPFPRKPDPAGLLDLMTRAGAAPTCTLMVGDSLIDYQTALHASARCCLVSYGFGYETFPAERLSGDEWIAASPAALRAIFEQFATLSSQK